MLQKIFLILHRDYIIAEEPLLICTKKDKYNAAGHFQLGVVQCHLGKLPEAAASFHQCEVAMRGNNRIDFKQLNMDAKLYLSDVVFNMGLVGLLCCLYIIYFIINMDAKLYLSGVVFNMGLVSLFDVFH